MTLLRTLLISLTLFVFSAPAYSDELASIALRCIASNSNSQPIYLTFEDGKINVHDITPYTPLRIRKAVGKPYTTFPFIIKWGNQSLNRSTLVLKYELYKSHTCGLINKDNLTMHLMKDMNWIKNKMKKNKF